MKAAIALLSDHHVQNVAHYIALFRQADGPIEAGTFICYKVRPLAGKGSNLSQFADVLANRRS